MKLETFQRVLKSIGDGFPLEATLGEIVSAYREKTAARRVGIWLFSENGTGAAHPPRLPADSGHGGLVLVAEAFDESLFPDSATHGRRDEEWTLTRNELSELIGRNPVLLRKPSSSASAGLLPESFWKWSREFAGFWMKFHGQPLGVLAVRSEHPLTEDEKRWGRTLAYQAAVAVRTLPRQSPPVSDRDSRADGTPLIGKSRRFVSLLERAELVARTDTCVLLTGPSGTGKSQLARHIHQRSARRRKRFVEVNCGSIAPHLFESEFFGHVKGAFTGAWRDRAGRFQFADGGTLFLDEIAEIPFDLQSRLLTVLQTGVFERVGEDESRKVDVRIVAATNRDLAKMVSEGRFRTDLYYRLNAFPIELPLLRERIEDIPLLAAHFLEKLCARYGCDVPELDEEHCRFLFGLEWAGNIRELEHRLERALILSNGGRLNFHDASPEWPAGPDSILRQNSDAFLRENDLRRIECENLRRVLTLARGKVYGKGGAADLLGVPPTTVMSRLKNFGLDREVRKSLVGESVGGKG